MLVEIDGPCHYINHTNARMNHDLMHEKIFKMNHKHLIKIPDKMYKKFINQIKDDDWMDDIEGGVKLIKEIIDQELSKK